MHISIQIQPYCKVNTIIYAYHRFLGEKKKGEGQREKGRDRGRNKKEEREGVGKVKERGSGK